MSSTNFNNKQGFELLNELRSKLDAVTEMGRVGEQFNHDEWLAYMQCKKTDTFLHALTIARAAASVGKELDEGAIQFETISILGMLELKDLDELNDRLHEDIRITGLIRDMVTHHKMAQSAYRMNNFIVATQWVYGIGSFMNNGRLTLENTDGFCYLRYLGDKQLDYFMELGPYPHMSQWQLYCDGQVGGRICFESGPYPGVVHMNDQVNDRTIRSTKGFKCYGTVGETEYNHSETLLGTKCPMYGRQQLAMWWSRGGMPMCYNCGYESTEFEVCSTELGNKRIGAEFKPVSIDDYISSVGEPTVRPLMPTKEMDGSTRQYTRDSVSRLSDALKHRNDRHSNMLNTIAEEARSLSAMDFLVDESTTSTNPFNDSKAVSRFSREDDEMTSIRDEMTKIKQFVRTLSLNGASESTIVPADSVTSVGEQANGSRVSKNGFIRSVNIHNANEFESRMIQGHMLSEEEAELAEKKISNLQVVCGLEPTFMDKRLDFLWYIHGPLEKYFSEVVENKVKYPSRQPVQCFKSMLKSKDDSPQTSLLRQVAISTFDFERGLVLNNLFDLPNIHPGMNITQTNIYIMLDQLQREYELKWHSVMHGGTMPNFANKFNERTRQRAVRTSDSQSSGSRRSSSSSTGSGSFVGSLVSYASGRTSQTFTR